MKLTFNPIKLRQQVRYYATLCSKQCLALINANDHIAELVAENYQQQKQIRFLQSELKIAQPDTGFSIGSMWEEPRPRVSLTLPRPLKEPQEGMYLITSNFEIYESDFKEGRGGYNISALAEGRYFATKEDAQEWLDAMRNARR